MSIYGNSKQLSQSYHNISNRKGSQSNPKSPSQKHHLAEGERKLNPNKNSFFNKAFNTNLLVENYAIKEQSQEELRYLTRIKALRKIEIFTKKVSGDLSAETMNRENIHELVIKVLI